jgi:fatty-acyl-CoA synthase
VAAWCRSRLADHKVPRSIVIVDAIPRTPRGKIDRMALLELRGAEKVPGLADG